MKSFPFYLAKRYLISKKSYNAINLIAYISVLAIALGTSALVVVLSVYNGFDELIKGMYNNFDPDYKISLAEGKVFTTNNDTIQNALADEGIKYWSPVLEETSLLEYNDQQTIARMKGVGSAYRDISQVDSAMVTGFYMPEKQDRPYACLGSGVAYRLSLNVDFLRPLTVWMPRRGKKVSLNPSTAFNTLSIVPSGVFSLETEFNSEYYIVPIAFAQELLDYNQHSVSYIEIRSKANADAKAMQKRLQKRLGNKYVVKNKYQQRELLYKIMQSEKWAIFLILLFVLIVASFNILASLTMLIIDKRKDIATLKSMGASARAIRHVFIYEGWMITGLGAIFGVLLGYALVFIQVQFGIIRFPSENFIVQTYPVKLILSDLWLVLSTVGIVGFGATYLPARFISTRQFNSAS